MKYFAYGMNTNEDEMSRRCPGAVSLGSAWIDNYELVFRTRCDIVKKSNAKTYGVLWDIDTENLRALDRLEGFPYYYTRFTVKVKQGKKSYKAIVYQMNDQSCLAEPSYHYLECVSEGYKRYGVPLSQIDDAINTVSCYLSQRTKSEYKRIWSPMIKDYV